MREQKQCNAAQLTKKIRTKISEILHKNDEYNFIHDGNFNQQII
jgi:hypothetical protein